MSGKANIRDKKKERTKQHILDAARKLFSKTSFHEVSVEEIASEALVSRTTVYNHFEHKDVKSEIYFELGTRAFRMANQITTDLYVNEKMGLSGLEQFLKLCEFTFGTVDKMPILFDILSEFYMRMNANDLGIEELHDKIARSYETEEISTVKDLFEESYLINFYAEVQQTAFIWIQAVETGKKDGSIQNTMNSEQIVHFANLTITGMVEQMILRRKSLERVKLRKDLIISNGLSLIKSFLL